MPATPIAFATKDNASGRLQSGINASVLSIPLQSGNGANFPQPYSGTATSSGSSTTLNCTGIGSTLSTATHGGKPIWNKTDGSWAIILTVSANSLTCTRLLGGTDNTWDNADVWAYDAFVATFAVLNSSNEITQYEQALITGRSTDTLSVPLGGRGYNGTTANAFATGDYVYLLVTSPVVERVKDVLSVLAQQVNANITSIADFGSTANGKGASLVGVEDAAGNYAATTVETVLAEVATTLASKVGLNTVGFFGDGSDSAPTWTSGATLNSTGEFEYTTATLPASQTLTVSPANGVLVIRNTGNVTINGTVDLDGKGGPGGNGATSGTASTGTAGNSKITGLTTGAGAGATTGSSQGAGGGGGASEFSNGATGESQGGTGGTGGTAISASLLAWLGSMFRGVVCGGGGGGGAGDTSNAGAAGGAGGGALVWYIGGNLTLGGSSVIRARGADGSGTASGAAGGGGGGGGGAILIIVAGSITNSGVTLQVNGGAGGAGVLSRDGGAGANGRAIIYSLKDGTLITA